MLYDRDYMRDEDRSRWRSPVVTLLVVLGAVFLVECFLRVYGRTSLGLWFGLSAQAVGRHEYWRILTYQFLHDAPLPLHILCNGVALWFFGRAVVERLGPGRFWQIYLGAGTIGGLFEVACQAWHPGYQAAWTVGASACVLGLAGAFCFLFPVRELTFFLYFFPVSLRSMTMFWVLFGFSAFGTLFPNGGIAWAAHLGGLLTGVGYVKLFVDESGQEWLRRFVPRRAARREEVPVGAARVQSQRPDRATPPSAPEPENSEDFIRREVDPILDKISAHGIQSLTERERLVLERARERMKRR